VLTTRPPKPLDRPCTYDVTLRRVRVIIVTGTAQLSIVDSPQYRVFTKTRIVGAALIRAFRRDEANRCF
jgi:hypothetical protein